MMARRVRDAEEHPFSLDSFLDIVANLVGILIRLIVMVGLTVKALPASKSIDAAAAEADSADSACWEAEQADRRTENARRQALHEQALAGRAQQLGERQRAQAQRAAEQAQLDAEAQRHAAEAARRQGLMAAYAEEAARLGQDTNRLASAVEQERSLLDRELAAARQFEQAEGQQREELADLKRKLEAEQAALDAERTKRITLDEQLAEIRRQLAALAAQPKPVRTWAHLGAGVASTVEIEERHFRCRGGKIADTGLHRLLAALRDEARRVRDGGGQLEGRVGPEAGCTLRYEFGRQAATVTQRAEGSGAWALELRRFELEAPDDLGDAPAVALAEGGPVAKVLAGAPPHTVAVTVWVYPDSFAAAKALELALHGQGYAVALRPLPADAPISGSPAGTASQAR